MEQSYRLRLGCPFDDFYQWTVLEGVGLTLEEVSKSQWDFICPTHGPQREKPFQTEVKRMFPRLRKANRRSEGRAIPGDTEQTA